VAGNSDNVGEMPVFGSAAADFLGEGKPEFGGEALRGLGLLPIGGGFGEADLFQQGSPLSE